MFASGEVVLVHSPKPDSRGKAEQHGICLGNPREALGKGFTPQQGRGMAKELLSANFFLCSQFKDQEMSYRRPRSTSLMPSSVTAASGTQGPSTPNTCVLVTQWVALTPAR